MYEGKKKKIKKRNYATCPTVVDVEIFAFFLLWKP